MTSQPSADLALECTLSPEPSLAAFAGHSIRLFCKKHTLGKKIIHMAGVTVEFPDEYAKAWNRHDTSAILSAMTADCVMQLGAGPDVGGSRFDGPDNVRAGIEKVF
jgi:hypothetical protein